MRPVTMRSIAFDLPMSRGSRCVPPVPGSTPRVTSGRPIRYSFFGSGLRAMNRRSHARAISSPPPTQCPFRAAMKSFGVFSNLSRVSWQSRQNIAL